MLYAYFGANNAVPPKGFTLIADNGAYRRILIGQKDCSFRIQYGYLHKVSAHAHTNRMLSPAAFFATPPYGSFSKNYETIIT